MPTDRQRTTISYLMDMDGVIVRGATVIPGAPEFIARLVAVGRKFLVLTNNPAYTPRELSHCAPAIAGPGPCTVSMNFAGSRK